MSKKYKPALKVKTELSKVDKYIAAKSEQLESVTQKLQEYIMGLQTYMVNAPNLDELNSLVTIIVEQEEEEKKKVFVP